MNGLERLILDLVEIAEAPLYSTYRWLGRQLGRDLVLREFLEVVERAVEKDVLRLWSIDSSTGDRTEYFCVPSGLDDRYRSVTDLDERYDPFGLSLTPGASVEEDTRPDWEFSLDFERLTFTISAAPGHERNALEEIELCYPDFQARVTGREETDRGCRLVGMLLDSN